MDVGPALLRVRIESGLAGALGRLLGGVASFIAPAPGVVAGSGGGIADLPDASCIRSHLQPGRKPTRQELETAWRLCTGQ